MLFGVFAVCFFMHSRSEKYPYHAWWQLSLDKTVPFERFASWLGDVDAQSRVAMRQYVKEKGYKTLLDVPSGLCIDYFGFQRDGLCIQYYGLDITQKLVKKAQKQGIDVAWGNIERMPYPDNTFDITYARHIVEHLPYYEKALSELIRVAKYETLIVFFIPPTHKNDFIDYDKLDGHMVYHNRYNREKLEQYVLSHSKVNSIEWTVLSDNEEILHVFLNN